MADVINVKQDYEDPINIGKYMQINEWKPNLVKPFSMLIVASRNSGKSHTIKYLINEYFTRGDTKRDLFIIFCESRDELDEYKEIVPGSLFFDKFEPSIFQTIREANRELITQGRRPYRTFILFDDLVNLKQKYNDALLQIFTRGRHDNFSIIFASQSYTFANASWRSNSDYILLLRQNSAQARRAVADSLLLGSIDLPDEINEKRFWSNVMKQYISKRGDVLTIDFQGEDAFNNIYKFRAPADVSPRGFKLDTERFNMLTTKAQELDGYIQPTDKSSEMDPETYSVQSYESDHENEACESSESSAVDDSTSMMGLSDFWNC